MRFIVIPGSPGCFPGRRFPRSRSDRFAPFFLSGLSEEGGREDVEESLPAWRSSSPTRSAKRSTCPVSPAISWYASASRCASTAAGRADSSSAEGAPGTADTPGNDHHYGQPVSHLRPGVSAKRTGQAAGPVPFS